MNISIAKLEDAQQMQILSDLEFGVGYLGFDCIKEIILDKRSYCSIIKDDNKVIAFCISHTGTLTEMKKDYNLGKENLNDSDLKACMIKTVVVSGEYKRQGLGTKLIKDTILSVKDYLVNEFFSLGWEDSETKKVNIDGILKRSGFVIISKIKNYWEQDSIIKNFGCPSCGNPCFCSAILYYKNTLEM